MSEIEHEVETVLRGAARFNPQPDASSPFSTSEEIWHTCPAHDWERFSWDKNAHIRERHPYLASDPRYAPDPEMVTRCRNCGAPRCDSYHSEPADGFGELSDNSQQLFRCTIERHHSEPHDFLTGVQIEVGG